MAISRLAGATWDPFRRWCRHVSVTSRPSWSLQFEADLKYIKLCQEKQNKTMYVWEWTVETQPRTVCPLPAVPPEFLHDSTVRPEALNHDQERGRLPAWTALDNKGPLKQRGGRKQKTRNTRQTVFCWYRLFLFFWDKISLSCFIP